MEVVFDYWPVAERLVTTWNFSSIGWRKDGSRFGAQLCHGSNPNPSKLAEYLRQNCCYHHFTYYWEKILPTSIQREWKLREGGPSRYQWLTQLIDYPRAICNPITPCCLMLQKVESQMLSHIPLQLWDAI